VQAAAIEARSRHRARRRDVSEAQREVRQAERELERAQRRLEKGQAGAHARPRQGGRRRKAGRAGRGDRRAVLARGETTDCGPAASHLLSRDRQMVPAQTRRHDDQRSDRRHRPLAPGSYRYEGRSSKPKLDLAFSGVAIVAADRRGHASAGGVAAVGAVVAYRQACYQPVTRGRCDPIPLSNSSHIRSGAL
jgi:hypothetical protein